MSIWPDIHGPLVDGFMDSTVVILWTIPVKLSLCFLPFVASHTIVLLVFTPFDCFVLCHF